MGWIYTVFMNSIEPDSTGDEVRVLPVRNPTRGRMRNFLKSMIPALAGAAAFCAGLCHAQNIAAPAIRLDFRIVSNGKTLRTSADGISRFDFILSEMALQDQSGTWIPSEEWFAYISAGEGRLQADTIGSPAGG